MSTAPQGSYAGGETCFACHDMEASFKKNPHYANWADPEVPEGERGCEGCHGPGQAHVDAGGDPEQIFRFKDPEHTPGELSDRCLDCHLREESKIHFLRNEHGYNTVACTDCHSIHSPHERENLMTAKQPALCYSCHGEIRAHFNKPFHHRIHEGFMSCTDCHNQHGGFNKLQLASSTGHDFACYECHADKQGPFVFEHPPIKVEGCNACHEVHGSTNPRLLKRSEVRFLCLECHSPSTNPGLFPVHSTPIFHNLADPEWQNCTSCHIQIHGSNLSPVFFE